MIHIGTEKTGTTTIQSFLRSNSVELARSGFSVPDFMGHPSQVWLPMVCYREERQDRLTRRWDKYDKVELRRTALSAKRSEFLSWARQQLGNEIWLSSEQLSSRLTTDEEVEAFRDLLAEIADDPLVLVYLRQPVEAAISALTTHVLGGGRSLHLPGAPDPRWNYQDLLGRWEKFFPGRVVVRLFAPAEFHGQHLVTDFLSAIQIPWDRRWQLPERRNESMSWSAMKILAALNAKYPRFLSGQSAPNRKRVFVNAVRNFLPDAPKRRATRSEYEAYHDQYAASNEWVRQRYFPKLERLWSSPAFEFENPHGYEIDLSHYESEVVDLVDRILQKACIAAPLDVRIIEESAAEIAKGKAMTETAINLTNVALALRPE